MRRCRAALAGDATAWAGTGSTLQLPQVASPKNTHGLTLTAEYEWVGGYGYRPIHLDLISIQAAKVDRNVRVELGMGLWGNQNYAVNVQLVIPSGETCATATVPLPQIPYAQTIAVRTWEDDELLEDLSATNPLTSAVHNWGDESLPRILFVSPAPPNVSTFKFLLSAPYYQFNNMNVQVRRPADLFAFTHRQSSQLLDEWIYYSALDIIFLSLDDARDLAAKRPGVWRALRRWNRTGGSLCIYGAGSKWAHLPEIEQLCGFEVNETEAVFDYRGWTAPSVDLFRDRVMPAISLSLQPPSVPKKIPFVWKPSGYGRVVAVADTRPFPGDAARWRWLIESLGPVNTRWVFRYGSVPSQPNPRFNEFLIADVGLPPIRGYRVLISLFVVTIGPLNYWLLKRKGRLYLFLFTVPLAAVITSGGLMCYALLSDGLTARLRARSFTYLDRAVAKPSVVPGCPTMSDWRRRPVSRFPRTRPSCRSSYHPATDASTC